MAETLRSIVERTISRLNQGPVNRPSVATFDGWVGTAPYTDIKLKDVTDAKLVNALVQLDTELVHIKTHDAATLTTTVAPWFRQQEGTPANDSFAVDSQVVINPIWPRYRVAQTVCDGIEACYPAVFAVKETELTSAAITANYELPSDVEGILRVAVEDLSQSRQETQIWSWSLDTKNVDLKKYLRISPLGVTGRKIRVTYKARPVTPDPKDLDTTWTAIGLPTSATDLPMLYALYVLIQSADFSKQQSYSIEQSDRARFVQAGSTSAISRRAEELFRNRLADEARKLMALYPPRPHKTLNG